MWHCGDEDEDGLQSQRFGVQIQVSANNKSKETYGQTRGLSNLEMKYVGKLAIIGALLKAKQA